MFQYPHGNFPSSEGLFSRGKLRLAHFLLQCTLFYPSPLLTIGPRPALPSPHTHNQLGHLEYGALDLPRVHKTTYAPVIYTPLCIMFWRRGYTLLGEVGGGWALEFPSFLGPKWHSPIGSMPFHRAQKTREFQGPTPSNFPT